MLPPFLHLPSNELGQKIAGSYSGVFRHKLSQGDVDAHVRWWPCAASIQMQTVVLFIPGNPGLVDFYAPFLSTFHNCVQENGFAILAHAHLGHTPHLHTSKTFGLLHQVEAVIEAFDAIKACWSDIKVVLVGHSVGAWLSLQVLKARAVKVDGLFMLFPTISHIARTPNGRRLSWLFHNPIPSVVSSLSILVRPICAPVLSLLYPSWPTYQKAVLRSLVYSPMSILASLTMARDEMQMITTPNASLLNQHSSKLWVYYARKDNWVGEEREKIVQLLGDSAAVRIVHCHHGIPHAFCILQGDLMASQCAAWLRQGGFCG